MRDAIVVDGRVSTSALRDATILYGAAWAKRVAMEELGRGSPLGPIMWRGCPECAGYGQPGWVVDAQDWSWKKCTCHDPTRPCLPMCERCGDYATANTSGVCHQCWLSREVEVDADEKRANEARDRRRGLFGPEYPGEKF